MVQQTLSGHISYLDADSHYGDNPATKTKDYIRDVFSNIGGMTHFLDNEKDPLIWQSLEDLQADTAGLVELNLD